MSGYIYITKLICLRKQFLALWPWDITRLFCVFKVIIKWDNLKKKWNLYCSLPEQCLQSTMPKACVVCPAACPEGMCLSLQAQGPLASCQKSVPGWRSPFWHHVFCVFWLEWTLKQTTVPAVPWFPPGGNKFTHSERSLERPWHTFTMNNQKPRLGSSLA